MRKASELLASELPDERKKYGDPELGRKLLELRRKYGLKQEQVAEEVQVSRNSLAGYEGGATMPTVFTLARLAAFYDVTLDELAGHLKPT